MGLFSKPAPKKKSFFDGGLGNHSETRDRIKWATDRSGSAADAVDSYKRKRGFGLDTISSEDVRRELARKDSWFRHASADDVDKALKD
ncbi:hypothetical protein LJC07_06600 [Christensenellaceae bacterium OttesenSCG-928-L17]|nr:hypothetical protein [Christensenellaceae bacterium OttesenSCG-928-L17]